MLLPVEDAKRHRCCGPDGCGEPTKAGRLCIASACIAWTWGADGFAEYDGDARVDVVNEKPVSGVTQLTRVRSETKYLPIKRGFCGYAPPLQG